MSRYRAHGQPRLVGVKHRADQDRCEGELLCVGQAPDQRVREGGVELPYAACWRVASGDAQVADLHVCPGASLCPAYPKSPHPPTSTSSTTRSSACPEHEQRTARCRGRQVRQLRSAGAPCRGRRTGTGPPRRGSASAGRRACQSRARCRVRRPPPRRAQGRCSCPAPGIASRT